MKITTLEIAGVASVLHALRLPFGKDCRSTIAAIYAEDKKEGDIPVIKTETRCHIDERDFKLLSTLVKRGTEHAKVIRGLVVYAEIEAPIYFLREMETYRAGRERLSSESTMHQQCRGLSGEELVKAKAEMPMGTEQRTVDMLSYQCLRNIVKQRHDHRLPEWHDFVEWVRTLPFAEELIFIGLNI
jgi:hypothetical protein